MNISILPIQNNRNIYYANNPIKKTPTFMSRLTHCNIGMMPDWMIGEVEVQLAKGEKTFLQVMKNNGVPNYENYQLRDKLGKIIGEIDIKINRIIDYDKNEFKENPSHVFVYLLRNYSNPRTKYYQEGLKEYKHIGTRLLQIAQRRSDESMCCGNIKLHAKNSSKEWYTNVLGFREEPQLYHYDNNTQLYLPPDAKEPLSKMYGGL